MPVNLVDLIPSLQREVSPPGVNQYVGLTDADWLGHLSDAFWEARLTGILGAYTEQDGVVVPLRPGDPDMPRDLQQVIVLFAGFRMALTSFQNINSSFRAKAGPVEYEVQKSAQTLRSLVDALKARLSFIINNISIYEADATSVAIFDSVVASEYALADGSRSWYVGG